MYDAINKGFKQASGDIYAYLNADDLYSDENVVENIVEQFLQNNVDLVYGNVEFIDEYSNHLYFYKSMYLPKTMIKYLKRVPFAQQTAFWNKEVYNELNGFDDSLKYVADSKFFFSILFNKQYNYKKINQQIAKFRWHDEGFSSREQIKMSKEYTGMLQAFNLNENYVYKVCVEVIIKVYNVKNIIQKRIR